MKNRVTLEICDKEYTLITEEDESYVQGLGKTIDHLIEDGIYKNLRSTKTDIAVLTCLDLLDQNNKLKEANDNMRLQISEYIDDIAKLNKQLLKQERQQSQPKSKSVNTVDKETLPVAESV